MKYYAAPPFLLLLLSAPHFTTAFPSSILSQAASQDPTFAARAAEILRSSSTFNSKRQIVTADGATRIFEPVGIFNAEAQLVDVGPGSGHEWIAPGPEDLRGPCPGLVCERVAYQDYRLRESGGYFFLFDHADIFYFRKTECFRQPWIFTAQWLCDNHAIHRSYEFCCWNGCSTCCFPGCAGSRD